MELFNNDRITSLAEAIDDAASSIVVASDSGWANTSGGTYRILVDSEIMIVTRAGSSTTTWAVTRGAEGTSAEAHSDGASVYGIFTAGALAQFKIDVEDAASGGFAAGPGTSTFVVPSGALGGNPAAPATGSAYILSDGGSFQTISPVPGGIAPTYNLAVATEGTNVAPADLTSGIAQTFGFQYLIQRHDQATKSIALGAGATTIYTLTGSNGDNNQAGYASVVALAFGQGDQLNVWVYDLAFTFVFGTGAIVNASKRFSYNPSSYSDPTFSWDNVNLKITVPSSGVTSGNGFLGWSVSVDARSCQWGYGT